ncbi:MAG TPA: GyrI-like domain-containing protein [Acidimicrobiales bacterium]|jgi:hypothetical protein|nr:GyrI-like domain-containing protein [Acidimicrobiales bacterium]
MRRSTVDDLAHIQAIWPSFQHLVSGHGRKLYGLADELTNTYSACTPIGPDDDAPALGLVVGTLPGGRYMRGRIGGDAPGSYGLIGPGMEELKALVAVDPSRPLVEFYRRHNQIELWVPIAS